MEALSLEELLERVSDPEFCPADYSPTEVVSIRNLASRFQTSRALGVIRDLKNEFQRESTLGIVSALARGYENCDDLDSFSIDDEAKLRIAVYQRNPDAQILRVEDDWVTLKAPALESLPRLPLGYAFKGGAARLALLGALGKEVKTRKPRDIDLVRFSRSTEGKDTAIARELMPEDFRFGHGVEKSRSYEDYFSTRDLTINEVFLIAGKVYCSKRCLEDLLLKRIRITRHGFSQEKALGRIYCKAIRLLAELRIEGDEIDFPDFVEAENVREFDIALHLDRALERGTRIAEKYVRECVSRGLLKNQNESLVELKDRLTKKKSSPSTARASAAPPKKRMKLF